MASFDWQKEIQPLLKKYKGKKHPLDYGNTYELVVMVVLSAQDSDAHINKIAPEFFKAFPDMKALPMSPVGGVGVNYAIQDAVALANAAVPSLRQGSVPTEVLAAVQRRRERPVEKMQRIQRIAHDRISRPVRGEPALPRGARMLLTIAQPVLRRVTARVVGRGFLPEHADLDVLDART